MPVPDHTIPALAAGFVERAKSLGLKGKRRDDAAIDYFVGAAKLAQLTGEAELCQRLAAIIALGIAVRGYDAVLPLSLATAPGEG